MLRRSFLQILLFSVFFFAIGANAADAYFCPMKCEGEKTYAAPGTCPVCGMDLEKKGAAGKSPTMTPPAYRVDLSTEPKVLKAGSAATLMLSPRKTADNSIAKELDVVHEKPMHLIAVSQDLSWFAHWHPEKQGDGNLKLSAEFPNGGNYVLYADFTPKAAENQVVPLAVQVEGKKIPAKKLKEAKGPRSVDGYEVSLKLDTTPKVGGMAGLTFSVKQRGKAVSDLENYLGALGHVVLISEDTTRYVHVHPMSGTMFHAQFPKAGLYKAWFEFKHGGKVRHVDFVIRVAT